MQEIVAQMTKAEAEEATAKILGASEDWYRTVGPIIKDVKDRDGWASLGFKSFHDYCKNLDERLGESTQVRRLLQRVEVETNLGKRIPAYHAYALAKLPNAEAQIDTYTRVSKDFPKPTEQNVVTYVEGWFSDHQEEQDKRTRSERAKDHRKGWTRADLEVDEDLAEALDRIEEVWGHKDRKQIQSGKLTRKEILQLSAFHADRMKTIHYLVMGSGWGVEESLRFVNTTPDDKTTIRELQSHCLSTPGFYFTCSVNGFDVTIKACKALSSKIRE